jgi:hypothetical protein
MLSQFQQHHQFSRIDDGIFTAPRSSRRHTDAPSTTPRLDSLAVKRASNRLERSTGSAEGSDHRQGFRFAWTRAVGFSALTAAVSGSHALAGAARWCFWTV